MKANVLAVFLIVLFFAVILFLRINQPTLETTNQSNATTAIAVPKGKQVLTSFAGKKIDTIFRPRLRTSEAFERKFHRRVL